MGKVQGGALGTWQDRQGGQGSGGRVECMTRHGTQLGNVCEGTQLGNVCPSKARVQGGALCSPVLGPCSGLSGLLGRDVDPANSCAQPPIPSPPSCDELAPIIMGKAEELAAVQLSQTSPPHLLSSDVLPAPSKILCQKWISTDLQVCQKWISTPRQKSTGFGEKGTLASKPGSFVAM